MLVSGPMCLVLGTLAGSLEGSVYYIPTVFYFRTFIRTFSWHHKPTSKDRMILVIPLLLFHSVNMCTVLHSTCLGTFHCLSQLF